MPIRVPVRLASSRRTATRTALAVTAVGSVMLVAACGGSSASSDSSSGSSTKPVTIKLGDVYTNGQPSSDAVAYFAKTINADKSAKITVDVYPDAELGEENTILQDIRSGSVQMGAITNDTLASLDPQWGIFSVPYLFKSLSDVTKYGNSSAGQEVLSSLTKYGLYGVGFDFSGWDNIISKNPVRSSADFKGMRIRVIPGPSENLTWQTFGATPVSVPSTQLYLSLQQNTVQGVTATSTFFVGNKLYEVAKYVNELRIEALADGFVINLKLWDSLSKTQQNLLTSTAKKAFALAVSQAAPLDTQSNNTFKQHGVTVTTGLSDQAAAEKLLEQKAYPGDSKILGGSVLKDAQGVLGSS